MRVLVDVRVRRKRQELDKVLAQGNIVKQTTRLVEPIASSQVLVDLVQLLGLELLNQIARHTPTIGKSRAMV